MRNWGGIQYHEDWDSDGTRLGKFLITHLRFPDSVPIGDQFAHILTWSEVLESLYTEVGSGPHGNTYEMSIENLIRALYPPQSSLLELFMSIWVDERIFDDSESYRDFMISPN